MRILLITLLGLINLLAVSQALQISPQASSTSVCRSTAVQLTANASGGLPPYQYYWTGNGIQVPNTDTTQVTNTTANVTDSVNYSVQVIDANNDTALGTITIYINDIAVDAGTDVTVNCTGTTNLRANTSGYTNSQTFAWSGPVTGTIALLRNASEGQYYVTVRNSIPCSATDSVRVIVNHNKIDFTISNVDSVFADGNAFACKYTNRIARFTNTSTVLTGWTWDWSSTSGAIGTGTDFSLTPTIASIDTIILVGDSAGCQEMNQHTLSSGPCTIGIEETAPSQSITLYPNPSNGHFTLTFNQASKQLNTELLNIQGQQLYTEQLKDVTSLLKEFDFSNLAKGVYLLKISTENGVGVKRVVLE